jgi:predicted ArsR family transcriptional regulator
VTTEIGDIVELVTTNQGDQEPSKAAITAIAALEDGLRRGMYAFIRQAGRPVSRDEAATAVGISRKLAAFHLDKLVDVGLLRARHEPVDGIRRVGRNPKVYEPSELDVNVSIPARQHDMLAEILLDAVLSDTGSARDSALRIAERRGAEAGMRARPHSRPGRLGVERTLTVATAILREYGFEPIRSDPACVRLRNCPFHPLAAREPELVCGINYAFLRGFLGGLKATTVRAVLEPTPGECCVHLTTDGDAG